MYETTISFILENSFEYLSEAVYWYAAILRMNASGRMKEAKSKWLFGPYQRWYIINSINFNTLLVKNAPGTSSIHNIHWVRGKIDINFSIDLVKKIHHSPPEGKKQSILCSA